MSKFWRLALSWMLAMALPVQGYAAHAMMNCGPAHAGTGSVTVHDHSAHAHRAQAMAAMSASPDIGLDAGHAHGHESDAAQPKSKPAGAGKCSACSSCCGAVAITASTFSIEVIPQQVPFVATIPVGYDLVLIGGLERPPRVFLA